MLKGKTSEEMKIMRENWVDRSIQKVTGANLKGPPVPKTGQFEHEEND